MKLRLVLISCILSIIPLFLFQLYFYYSTQRLIFEAENKSNALELRSSAEDISDKVNSAIETLNLFSQLSLPKVSIDFKRPEALNEFLISSNKKSKLFEKLIVFDSDFEYFASSIPSIDVFSLIDDNQKFKNLAKLLSESSNKDLVQEVTNENGEIISFYVTNKLQDESGRTIGYFVGLLNKDIIHDHFSKLRSRIKSTDSKNITILMTSMDKLNDYKCNSIFLDHSKLTNLCVFIPDSRFSVWLKKNVLFIFLILLVLGVIYALIYHFFIGRILSPFYQFLGNLTKITEGDFVDQSVDSKYSEINALISLSNSIVKKLKSHQKNEIEKVKIEVVAKVATQAAHDIRSPLEMLKGIKEDLALLPEESRRRIQLGINRIEEITFNLLKANRLHENQSVLVEEQELLGIILSVLTEKRIEFRKRDNLRLLGNFETHSFGLFSKINRNVLKSTISNLINNSADAISLNPGEIELELFSENNFHVLKVRDNGVGIDSLLAEKLFTKGVTTKGNGNGLGLFNARQDIESFGGQILFESTVGMGTTFKVLLPKSDAPSTFIGFIPLDRYEKIIVLDDDSSFHDFWRARFQKFSVEIEFFSSVHEFLENYSSVETNTLLLTDFELMDEDYDGIDIINLLRCRANSVLVTARSEELEIQKRCQNAEIKILPKLLVNFIPIVEARPPSEMLVVLIDDDKLVRINWNMFCQKYNISLQTYSSIDDFVNDSISIPKHAKIFIDSNLGNDVKGEVESEKLFKLGYKNLYLSTGYQVNDINKPSWIIKVFSKGPDILLHDLSS